MAPHRLISPRPIHAFSPQLYSNRTYTVTLHTFDRFNNPLPHGGLAVSGRLQLIKSGVHDLTTLYPLRGPNAGLAARCLRSSLLLNARSD